MQYPLLPEVLQYARRNSRRRAWRKFVQVLGCIVVFCTTYALILPAITMEQKAFCGHEEHIHDESCYVQTSAVPGRLVCTSDQLMIHTHTPECFDASGSLLCGQADYIAHTHDSRCWDADGNLVCTLPEMAAHVHTESCYALPEPVVTEPVTTESAETIPVHTHTEECYTSVKGALLCTVSETEGHTHGEECYGLSENTVCGKAENHVHGDSCYETPLTCTKSTEAHVHSDSCYGPGPNLLCTTPEGHIHGEGCYQTTLVCTNTEEGHVHEESCIASQLICTVPENHTHAGDCFDTVLTCTLPTEAHVHGDGCYAAEATLICTEAEGHIHDDTCRESILTCQISETQAHTHEDACYEWTRELTCGLEESGAATEPQPTIPAEPVLVCTIPIAPVHIHSDLCFEAAPTAQELTCTKAEGEDHTHTALCYGTWEKVCEIEEHEHTLVCYSNPDADVETEEIWKRTFAHVELTGDWNKDVLAIAETQLGYTESSKNYAVWEDNSLHGYTRYGDWYGSAHGDWCAMFVSFCLHYAEVEGMPLHWGVRPWIEELTELKLYHEAEVYEPKPGDIIFFDWEGDDLSDHVGIVAEIIPESEFEPPQVKALEGNSSNCVQYVYYHKEDDRILGYSELPPYIPDDCDCGTYNHTHSEYCCDEEGNLTCLIPEHVHTEDCLAEEEPTETTTETTVETTAPIIETFCGFEEHTHEETCFDEEGNLICELTEHTHSEECEVEPKTYFCGLEEHTHEETCFDEEGNLICELEEHTHTEECEVEPKTYFCGLEEHTHEEACFDEEGNLICELEEHTHSEECEVEPKTYFCGLEEHTHEETCFDEEGNLICELTEHTHTEECEIEPEIKTYFCGLEEHTHEDACFDEEGNLICELEEHTHSEECEVEPEIKTYFCGLEEHTHEEICFDEEGNLVCELEEHTHSEECEVEPKTYFCGLDEHTHEEACFDEEGNLICELEEHTHTEECESKPDYICGLEAHVHDEHCYDNSGNLTCELPEHTHTDECLSPDEYVCGLTAHSHDEGCYGEDGSLICELPEHSHTPDCLGRNLFYSTATLRVKAVIRGATELPRKLTLDVQPITQEENPEAFGSMQVAVSQEVANQDQYVGATSFYQMQLLSEGQAYTLPEGATITVTMEFTEPIFKPEDMADSVGTHAFMVTPEGGALLPPAAPAETIPEDAEVIEEESGFFKMPALFQLGHATETLPAEDDPEPEENSINYQISPVTGEVYQNQNQGITSVTFETGELSTFAVLLASETVNGPFWERVSSITSGGTYMIVSAQGNYALLGNGSAKAVRLQPIKGVGNEKYYQISYGDGTALSGSDHQWKITNGYTIQNIGTSKYLRMSFSLVGDQKNLSLSYVTPEKCWRIANGSNYLRYTDNKFTYNGTQDSIYRYGYGPTTYQYYSRDMLIFKLSDVQSLSTPSDVTSSSSGSMGSQSAPPKPDYGEFINPSDFKTGDTAVSDKTDATITVSGKYYSDPATSALEKNFRADSVTAHQLNDGKVMTDKSVIYGYDDYGAFSDYDDNTFGVTLSALGQAYPIPKTDDVRTPVDVVFVLDVSGSMSSEDQNEGRTSDRAKDMVAAVNQSIAQIMENHDANRIGIVLYSGGAWEMLPLDRYTAENGQYLITSNATENHPTTGASRNMELVLGSSSLKNESGTSFANAGHKASEIQGWGTYTQAGIALGRKLFHDIGNDTTYTTTIGEGDSARQYTVIRQPVMILLSDGEPTYSTSNYMDVLNGPVYGDGNGGLDSAKGIHGYYTILSANYYKRMVGIHYQKPALFYTIGMSIAESGSKPMIDGSATGDHYKRAVLNPTSKNISALTEEITGDYASENNAEMLYSLLNGSYNSQWVQVTSNWPDPWTGVPHTLAPVLQPNPYAGDYSYADHAYFGEMTEEELSQVFAEIIEDSVITVPYGFILYKNSSVQIEDPIGAGMEVKGTPVLRYGGRNFYNPTVTTTSSNGSTIKRYTYNDSYTDPYMYPVETVDLSLISVTVITDADGNQMVSLYVPDNILPVYMPETRGGIPYYYEALPVRLIYQVGLTEASQQEVLALQEEGGEKVFYTNHWEAENHAATTLVPSEVNPFYHRVDLNDNGIFEDTENPKYRHHENTKTNNTTGTASYSVNCYESDSTHTGEHAGEYIVYHELGNNGKLVFTADPPDMDIPVEKQWINTSEASKKAVTVRLYVVTETITEGTTTRTAVLATDPVTGQPLEPLTLNAENQWKGSFTQLPTLAENSWYAVMEVVPDGYQVRYSGTTEAVSIGDNNGAPVTVAKAVFPTTGDTTTAAPIIVTNSPAVELPETGGEGTTLYTLAGTLLLTTAVLAFVYNQFLIPRKEDGPSF